jgi:hypothetical protein
MIDGAGLEGPRRLSPPPQLTIPEKSCFQSNKSVDGLASIALAFCSVDVLSKPVQGDR